MFEVCQCENAIIRCDQHGCRCTRCLKPKRTDFERDRLLQSSGGITSDLELPIKSPPKAGPAVDDRKNRKEDDHDADEEQRRQIAEGLRSAEPNPPGRGEPVAGWRVGDAVEKYTGDYCAEGTVLSAYQLPTGAWRYDIGLTRITKGMIIHIFSGANLRAAPLSSPGDQGPIIDALHKAFIAAGHTSPDGTWIAAGTNSVIATVLRTLRTRATATGGGDNG